MFKEIAIEELMINPVTAFGKDWMLLTAGTEGKYNTMTVGWGHLGEVWGLPTAIAYVRPQRYTKEFMDREGYFTLTLFPEEYHKALGYLGSRSGRDEDKVATAGLTPVFDGESTYFEEAKLVLICRKIYQTPLKEEAFVDHKVYEACYPDRSCHEVYYGEIIRVLVKE